MKGMIMAKSTGQIYVASTSGVASTPDGEIVFTKGVTRIREGHPLLKQLGHYFEPLEVQYEVEDTTPAPGERRGSPPAKK
jgi:hypothetical protein